MASLCPIESLNTWGGSFFGLASGRRFLKNQRGKMQRKIREGTGGWRLAELGRSAAVLRPYMYMWGWTYRDGDETEKLGWTGDAD
jgi:hypothetical protein